jgi:hypothetical protein
MSLSQQAWNALTSTSLLFLGVLDKFLLNIVRRNCPLVFRRARHGAARTHCCPAIGRVRLPRRRPARAWSPNGMWLKTTRTRSLFPASARVASMQTCGRRGTENPRTPRWSPERPLAHNSLPSPSGFGQGAGATSRLRQKWSTFRTQLSISDCPYPLGIVEPFGTTAIWQGGASRFRFAATRPIHRAEKRRALIACRRGLGGPQGTRPRGCPSTETCPPSLVPSCQRSSGTPRLCRARFSE